MVAGTVFNIQRYSIDDGPGIRTTVFLKGCPLRCPWCHNPESNTSTPQLAHYSSLCTGCGACVASCPQKLTRMEGGKAETRLLDCVACGACVLVCPAHARELVGRLRMAEDVANEALRDRIFYGEDGGVTLSGGEPLSQPAFSGAILRRIQAEGVHTAVETCGFATVAELEQVIPWTDLVLFDLKHMDDESHRRLTGQGNKLIHENLRRIVNEYGKPVWIRLPLIAEINDSDEDAQRASAFVKTLAGAVRRVCLLPYHNLGVAKLQALHMSAESQAAFRPPKESRLKRIAEIWENEGFHVTVG